MDLYFQLAELVVMGLLTFLAYMATRSSAKAADRAAQAAEASYKLSIQMYEHQKKELEKASSIRKNHVIGLMNEIINVTDMESSGFFDMYVVQRSPLDHGLTHDELSTFFNVNEAKIISEFWNKYKSYVERHWKNSRCGWKDSSIDWSETVDLGNDSIKLHEDLLQLRDKFEGK
jgi:hypothetical protein